MTRENQRRSATDQPTQGDYEALSEFRYLIRCFMEFSQSAAVAAGLTARQHQALLAIRGFPPDQDVTIGDLAERLRIRHHSAVELVDRLCVAGLVRRGPDTSDHRRVLLNLTELSNAYLRKLSVAHLDEIARLGPALQRILVNQRCRNAGEPVPGRKQG